MVKGITKTIRVSVLLVLLMGLGGFYFYSLGQRSVVPEANVSAPDAAPKPAPASEVLSTMRQVLRRYDFAALGVADAMSDVGKIYWQGNAAAGVTPDKEQALRWWIRAADIGNDRALVELSQVKNDPSLLELVKKIRAEQPPKATPPAPPRPVQHKAI